MIGWKTRLVPQPLAMLGAAPAYLWPCFLHQLWRKRGGPCHLSNWLINCLRETIRSWIFFFFGVEIRSWSWLLYLGYAPLVSKFYLKNCRIDWAWILQNHSWNIERISGDNWEYKFEHETIFSSSSRSKWVLSFHVRLADPKSNKGTAPTWRNG